MRWLFPLFFLMSVISVSAGSGECQISLRHKAGSGLEGWTEAKYRHSKGAWMNGTLAVRKEKGDIQLFQAQYAFIVGWDFCRNDTCVVIQSQNSHGPYYWQLFDLSTGKLKEDFFPYKADKFPDWVIDFTEQLK